MRVLRRIIGYALRYWRRMILALICLLASTAVGAILPQFIRWAIDIGIGQGKTGLLLWLVMAGVGATALRGLFSFGQNYTMEYISQKVAYDIRKEMYEQIQILSFSYHDRARSGQLMARATSDVEVVRRFVGSGVVEISANVLIFLTILVFLLFMHVKLTLLSISTIPILVYVVVNFSKRIVPLFQDMQQQLALMTNVIEESLTGIRVVKAFGREDYEIGRFSKENILLRDKGIRIGRTFSLFFPLMGAISGIGTVFILWYGGYEVMRGHLTLGELMAFNSYLGMLIGPIRMLGRSLTMAQEAVASGRRIFEILDSRLMIEEKPDAMDLPDIKGHIRFENVSFTYALPGEEEPLVLKNINLDIPPGKVVALLGPVGCGKTTVINLIPRFYDPTEGRILIDGYDIRDVTLKSLRRQIGIVMQETFLFSTTIKENIAYGKPSASMEEIIEAAKAAEIHDFIQSLPKGYETVVGERGLTLSGGQRQRIAIARALLADPRILLLDEPTSSVDLETEAEIQRALDRLIEGRTTLIIAQRPSTILKADIIVVMDKGEIVEIGTHDELIRKEGFYKRFYETHFAEKVQEGYV
jgi:ABC-type multidrug transport system fused ATPase/permease subunit